MKRISQAQARRAIRELEVLKARARARGLAWSSDYPGGVHIGSVNLAECQAVVAAIATAYKLDHHVVVKVDKSDNKALFYAVKP